MLIVPDLILNILLEIYCASLVHDDLLKISNVIVIYKDIKIDSYIMSK
jgi:hypothetical protein